MRLLALLFVSMPLAAAELLVNGAFESPLDSGWARDSGGHARATFSRGTGYHPDPDYEARVHLGPADGYAAISQTVAVPSLALAFGADLSLYAHITEPVNWTAASCRLTYRDSLLAPLGETRIFMATARCTWHSGPTIHLIRVADSAWHRYELDIAAEMRENLPGIDPARVKFITVHLRDTAGAS